MKEVMSRVKSKACELVTSKGFVAASAAVVPMMSALTAHAEVENTLTTDASTITTILTSVISMFGTYPLNILLAVGLISAIIPIFRRLKGAAR